MFPLNKLCKDIVIENQIISQVQPTWLSWNRNPQKPSFDVVDILWEEEAIRLRKIVV